MIPVFKPYIGAATIKAAVDSLHLGWLGMGSYVREFEAEFARTLALPEDRTVVAVNTCTSALHLALLSAGVGPGDEVITPSLNNIGDFQAIGMCGARPVFVDIAEADLALNPALLERAVGPRTKAIIPLHYMGIPCKIDEIYSFARAAAIAVVEDAAHATASRIGSRMIGAFGDFACFSFDAIKTVTCIDGGAVVLPKEKAAALYPRRLLGMTQSNERLYSNSRAYEFDVLEQGFRYHLANLHAAIGLSQLGELPMFIANRRSYARLYNDAFCDLPGVVAPQSDFDGVSLFHYVLRIRDGRREEFREFLRDAGVDTGVHWLPGHWFSWLKGSRGADHLPVTDMVGKEIVTLPLWSQMDDDILSKVIDTVRRFARTGSAAVERRVSLPADALSRAKSAGLERTPIPGFPDMELRIVNTTSPQAQDVELITRWRNKFVRSFLTEFEATEERTRNWLTEAVGRDDTRVLFMVQDVATQQPIGYAGLAFIDWRARTGEADAVVRGSDGSPGVMRAALGALLAWAKSALGLEEFGVRVLADNPAVRFYSEMGFREIRRVPLMKNETTDGVAWTEAKAGEGEPQRELVHMMLGADRSVTWNAKAES